MSRHGDGAWGDPPEGVDDAEPFVEQEPRDTIETPEPACAYCGKAAEGNYSIHRDGYGAGPEVPLCDDHGGSDSPSCADIWAHIAKDPS